MTSVSRIDRSIPLINMSIMQSVGLITALVVLCGSPFSSDPVAEESPSVRLESDTVVRVVKRVLVNVNPERDLHGPCVVRAGNGDLLLCHRDSLEHIGGDSFVRQWRSTDNGFTWQDEGAVADWRSRQIDSSLGEYGKTPDGRLVLFVQRRKPRSGDQGVVASWLQKSDDHGKSWTELGPVDSRDEYAFMYGRNVLTRDGVMYVGAWSRLGNALYVSTDNVVSWSRRSVVFPTTHPDFESLVDAGGPFYPHVVLCPDGSLLAMTFDTPPKNRCYSRRSTDNGRTWGPIKVETLQLWAPRMKRYDDRTLIVTGRDVGLQATVAWFSTDNGETWGHKLILDKRKFSGSYGYTDSIDAGDGKFWVFTSSPQTEGMGDIIGLLLEGRIE